MIPATESYTSDLLGAFEQAVMDMETFRIAMNVHDRAYFAPCVERARAAIAVAHEHITPTVRTYEQSLRAALRRYGSHDRGCPGGYGGSPLTCTCGYAEACRGAFPEELLSERTNEDEQYKR